jgi:hypothetical protein
LIPTKKLSFSFSKPGTYPHFCSIHPNMTGKVLAQQSESNQANKFVHYLHKAGRVKSKTEEKSYETVLWSGGPGVRARGSGKE